MTVTATHLRDLVDQNRIDRGHPRVIAYSGEIVVIQAGDRLFLYNQTTYDAFEVKPDMNTGIVVEAI